MTREREIQAALERGCSLNEVLRMAKPPFSYAARECADELERLDMTQFGPGDETPWTPAYKVEVIKILERWRWR